MMSEPVGLILDGTLPEQQKKSTKVKELEEKIKKLESENKKLLNKVHSSSPSPERVKGVQRSKPNGTISVDDDELEKGLLDIKALLNENEGFKEDEWLYVSPKLPPTPQHKKITPRQWLSEGHNSKGSGNEDIPSLNDVRKSLIYNIEEAENLDEDLSSYATVANIKRRARSTNKAGKITQNNRSGQELSGSSSHEELSESREAVPVVRWKAKVPPADSPLSLSLSEQSEEEQAPPRSWKVKQVPSEVSRVVPPPEVEGEEGQGGTNRSPRLNTRRQAPPEANIDTQEIPVVRWKAKVPDDDDVPEVKWKAKVPPEGPGDPDVPVVKWNSKRPEGSRSPDPRRNTRTIEKSDVPVVKWKADGSRSPDLRRNTRTIEKSDVPMVKWKARMPEDSQSPDPRRNTRTIEESDVPIVKWKKAKMPEESMARTTIKVPSDSSGSDVSVIRRKAKIPDDEGSDVPVVNWKAKMPSESSDTAVSRRKAKMPEDSQSPQVPVVRKKAKMPDADDIPVVKWKAKVPEDQSADIPVVKWKAKMPVSEDAPTDNQGQRQPAKGARMHRKVIKTSSPAVTNTESVSMQDEIEETSSSHRYDPAKSPPLTPPPLSPPLSPTLSQAHQTAGEAPPPSKPLSRRSSFSESRSPSPPSISPQVRMAMGSPILSRRTPSPSRSLNTRQSPSASPALQQKHLQYIGGVHSPAASRSFTGIPSSASGGQGSRLRAPRSQSTGMVKTSSPLKGLTPPGERKSRRMLPSPPSRSPEATGRSRSREKVVRNKDRTPTPNNATDRFVHGPQAVSAQDTGGDEDDDSWLEGCY